MCFHDVLETLRAEGITVSTSQLRWAIDSGKVTRPSLDGSLRFSFDEEHLAQLRAHFRAKVDACRQRSARRKAEAALPE